ncbi:DMT family transporter [Roseomonas sp. CECT 9278]|uniref:DMT family transporter n=1 Tax=Roseomonas sp. CECT 9278 TaxID=2845823 RepID=UPI001E32C786|nr:DMT family transporter [Roseomonas sp. CECT 9278]CAH0228705.1 Riboflavin transporter [Roseomonas sp. CECT 9278]
MTAPPAGARRTATLRGMAWMALAGFQFCLLNAVARHLAQDLDPFQTQFLRYLAGLVVLLPFILRTGLAAWRPHDLRGQAWRGLVHTAGLLLWFWALPHIALADTTAIGFTGPIFIMAGAVLFLGEPFVRARWIAAGVGLLGIAVVVAPQFTGTGGGFWSLVMLATVPLFAASFLITKALTRRDRPEVIVAWQAITVTIFTLPFALPGWTWPTAEQWGWFLLTGLLGSAGHWCLTEAFRIADISATQPVKFLDIIWAAALGWLVFSDVPAATTFAGAAIIFAATTWIARREARRR